MSFRRDIEPLQGPARLRCLLVAFLCYTPHRVWRGLRTLVGAARAASPLCQFGDRLLCCIQLILQPEPLR